MFQISGQIFHYINKYKYGKISVRIYGNDFCHKLVFLAVILPSIGNRFLGDFYHNIVTIMAYSTLATKCNGSGVYLLHSYVLCYVYNKKGVQMQYMQYITIATVCKYICTQQSTVDSVFICSTHRIVQQIQPITAGHTEQ